MSDCVEPPKCLMNIASVLDGNEDLENFSKFLQHPKIAKKRVVVVGIAGAVATGKTFMLCHLANYLRNHRERSSMCGGDNDKQVGIAWENDGNRSTTGILVWSETLKVDEKGDEVIVLFADMQGLFEQSLGVDAKLFAFMNHLCSLLLLNVQNRLELRDLESFELLEEYSDTISNSCQVNGKANRILLVRDWECLDEFPCGFDGGLSYLQKRRKNDRIDELLTKLQVRDDEGCFLMPHPGKRATQLSFTGRNAELDDEFLNGVNDLFHHLVEKMKNLSVDAPTGEKLLARIERYNTALKDARPPVLETLTVATTRTNHHMAMEESFKIFKKGYQEHQKSDDMDSEAYNSLFLRALDIFEKSSTFGSEEIREGYRQKLIIAFQDLYKSSGKFDELLMIKSRNESLQMVHQQWSSYKSAMKEVIGINYQSNPRVLAELHKKEYETAVMNYQKETGMYATFDEEHLIRLKGMMEKSYLKFKDINDDLGLRETLASQEDLEMEYHAYLILHKLGEEFTEELEKFLEVYVDENMLKEQISNLQHSIIEALETTWSHEAPHISRYRDSLLKNLTKEYENCMENNARNKKVFDGELEESAARMRYEYLQTMQAMIAQGHCDEETLEKMHKNTKDILMQNFNGEIKEIDDSTRKELLEEAGNLVDDLLVKIKKENDKTPRPPTTWEKIQKYLPTADTLSDIKITKLIVTLKDFKNTITQMKQLKKSVISVGLLVPKSPQTAAAILAVSAVAVTAYCVYKVYQRNRENRRAIAN